MNIQEMSDVILNEIYCNHEVSHLKGPAINALKALHDYGMRSLKNLSDRVNNEYIPSYGDFTIWTTILPKNRKRSSPYLSPLSNHQPDIPAIEAIVEDYVNSGKATLDTLFIDVDESKCEELRRDKRIIPCHILCGEHNENVGVRLQPATRYIEQIQELYSVFYCNSVNWTTINAPHFRKFFDLQIVRCNLETLKKQDSITGYEIDIGPLQNSIIKDVIPMWNIETISMVGQGKAIAAVDKENFEYTFDIPERDFQNTFLAHIDPSILSHIRREKGRIIGVTHKSCHPQWTFLKISKRRNTTSEELPFDLSSNYKEQTCNIRNGSDIKSEDDIRLYLSSFHTYKKYELESIRFLSQDIEGQTYNANDFLENEIIDAYADRTLALYFKRLHKKCSIDVDIISFLTSQLQLLIPEYICKGFIQ